MSATLASIETNECEGTWIQQELLGCTFRDERLAKRFGMVLQQLSEGTAESIPLACQDWANTKAAYRFLRRMVPTVNSLTSSRRAAVALSEPSPMAPSNRQLRPR